MNILLAKLWELGEFKLVLRAAQLLDATHEIDPVYGRMRDHIDEITQLLYYDPKLYTNILYSTRDMLSKLRTVQVLFDTCAIYDGILLPANCPPLLVAILLLAKASPHPYLQPVLPPATHREAHAWVAANFNTSKYMHDGHVDMLVPYHVFTIMPNAIMTTVTSTKSLARIPQTMPEIPAPLKVYYVHNTYEQTKFKIWEHCRFYISRDGPATIAAEINSSGAPDMLTFPQLLRKYNLRRHCSNT